MPNPTQPMNEEELRKEIVKIVNDMAPDYGDELLKLILDDRNAAIREARIEEHNRLEEYISTPFDRRVSYRNTPNLAFDDGANDVKYWIRKWSKTRVEQLQSQPNTKEEE